MLKRSVMLISVVLLLFVGLAMPSPAEGAIEWDGPYVGGLYTVKCNIKFYDWTCNKILVIKEAEWLIEQEEFYPKIECWFHFSIPEGWLPGTDMELYSPNGYVGPFVRKTEGDPESRIKNKPRLSQWGDDGTFCLYSSDPGENYGTWVINAKVKVDSKTGAVKYIKGRIDGWGEFGPPLLPPGPVAPGDGFWVPTLGQFEGKFKATPVPK